MFGRRLWLWCCLLSVLILFLDGCVTAEENNVRNESVSLEGHSEHSEELQGDPAPYQTTGDELYEKAMALRKHQKDLKMSVHQLYAAAGVVHLSMNQSGGHVMDGVRYFTADDVEIRWRNNSIQHVDAVRELIFAFRDGSGAPLNPAIAHRLVREMADFGVVEFQADLASMYSLGIEPVAPNENKFLFILKDPNMDLAMLHFMFAAKGDDPLARMALGYRHLHGIGVQKNCHAAALYYENVASSVVSAATIDGGLPSVSKKRFFETVRDSKPLPTAEQEFFHYQWFAEYGHAEAARAVAHLLTHGDEQNLVAALDYLLQAADMGDADAMAHVGHAYANGIAVAQNNETARKWFVKSAEKGHPSGLLGLGVMHLTGEGAQVDHALAAKYFKRASEMKQEWIGRSDAHFYAGLVHLHGWGTQKDVGKALQYFEKASKGNNLLASYNLAVLYLSGAQPALSNPCEAAVDLLKKVSERGWAALSEASKDFDAGDYGWALYNYLKVADIGVELAQNNAAWMLRNAYGYDGYRSKDLATYLLKLSASQGNTGAWVPLGDAYWYGHGVDVDLKKAGVLYTAASKINQPRALFNLAYMHQYGLGMPRDLFIAKRYYDQAMQAGPGAYLPNALAVSWLRVHQAWNFARSRLPDSIVSVIDPIFDANSSSSHKVTVFSKISHALRVPLRSLARCVDMLEDAVDSLLFLWIIAIIGLIFWKKRTQRPTANDTTART